ncbi:MAG TPA: fibronectin type III domain-containing protein, partial [Ktedonobacteraceae bacterium]|nr:fibronectin type III domain-containing protein [Ktedonobacteraceae bacterium]
MRFATFSWLLHRMALPLIITVFVLMLLSILTSAPAAQAKAMYGNCPVDRPCLTDLSQQGHTIDMTWTNANGYDAFNIQWSRSGTSGQQFEVDGSQRSSRLTKVYPYTTYTFSIQGCVKHFLAPSTCSPWSYSEQITTQGSSADVCKQGFVWREAGPKDYVCVTPYVRSQAAADNQQANTRRDPNGAYGPDTCLQGYVWREAFSHDHVCVTPETRAQAADDNR